MQAAEQENSKRQRFIALGCPYPEGKDISSEHLSNLLYFLTQIKKENSKVGILSIQGHEDHLFNLLTKGLKVMDFHLYNLPSEVMHIQRGNGFEETYLDHEVDYVVFATHPKYYSALRRFVRYRLPGKPIPLLIFTKSNAKKQIFEIWEDDTPLMAPKILTVPPLAGSKRLVHSFMHLMECLGIQLNNVEVGQAYFHQRAIHQILTRPVDGGQVCFKGELIASEAIDRYYGHILQHKPNIYQYCTVHVPISTEVLALAEDADKYYLIRDPRDMVNSFYHRMKHDSIQNELQEFLKLEKEDAFLALIKGMDFVRKDYFQKWLPIEKICHNFITALYHDAIYVIRWEDLRYRPEETYKKLLEHMRIETLAERPCLEYLIPELVRRGTFEYQTGGKRKEGEGHDKILGCHDGKHILINCRNGESRDWEKHFSHKVKDAIKERAGQYLIELGYEKDMNW